MVIRIRIDPNVRTAGNSTYAGFEDCSTAPEVGDQVIVHEPEAGIEGTGRVTSVDWQRRIVYLDVDWASLHDICGLPAILSRIDTPAEQFDELMATIDQPDPTPNLARTVARARDIPVDYLQVRDCPPGGVARTMQVRPDLLVDADREGRVLGVERIGAPVDIGDLADVLRVARL